MTDLKERDDFQRWAEDIDYVEVQLLSALKVLNMGTSREVKIDTILSCINQIQETLETWR